MEALGRLPEVGDVFEEHGLKVEVLELDGRRIENVHVTDLREDEADEDENEEKDKDSSDGEQQTFFKN